MDFHSEHLGFHSEILGYMEKQKIAKEEAAKALPSVPSFRLEKGVVPCPKQLAGSDAGPHPVCSLYCMLSEMTQFQ